MKESQFVKIALRGAWHVDMVTGRLCLLGREYPSQKVTRHK